MKRQGYIIVCNDALEAMGRLDSLASTKKFVLYYPRFKSIKEMRLSTAWNEWYKKVISNNYFNQNYSYIIFIGCSSVCLKEIDMVAVSNDNLDSAITIILQNPTHFPTFLYPININIPSSINIKHVSFYDFMDNILPSF